MERAFQQEIQSMSVSAPRRSLLKYLVFFGVCDVIMAGMLLFSLVVAGSLLFVQPSLDLSFVITLEILMGILFLLALFLVIFLSSFAFFTMGRLLSHKPTLLITPQGIHLQNLPAVGSLFLFWNEVASVSVITAGQSLSGPIHHLCLTPKNPVQFLSRFHPLRRMLVRFGSVATGTLIPLPQWFLSEPVEHILTQIQETFQEELRRDEVQIVRPSSEKERL